MNTPNLKWKGWRNRGYSSGHHGFFERFQLSSFFCDGGKNFKFFLTKTCLFVRIWNVKVCIFYVLRSKNVLLPFFHNLFSVKIRNHTPLNCLSFRICAERALTLSNCNKDSKGGMAQKVGITVSFFLGGGGAERTTILYIMFHSCPIHLLCFIHCQPYIRGWRNYLVNFRSVLWMAPVVKTKCWTALICVLL